MNFTHIKYVREEKVYRFLYSIAIHRVYASNTRCICIKYTVYTSEIQRLY